MLTRLFILCCLLVPLLDCTFSSCVLADESVWRAAKLKNGAVSYGKLTGNNSITVDGKFSDTSATYDVVEEKEAFVKLSDGKASGWVFKVSVTRVDAAIPPAPAEPAWVKEGGSPPTVRDPLIGTEVFFKESAIAKIGTEVIDKHKYLNWPDTVEDVQGEWLWLRRAWIRRTEVMELQEAFDYYVEEVRKNPTSSIAWTCRASCWSSKGEFGNAIKDYNEAIRLDPRSTVAYNDRGTAKASLKDYDRAIKDYDEAIRLDPTNATAYSNRGIAKKNLKDFEGSIKDYDEAIRLDPKFAIAYSNRGWSKHALKDCSGAIQDYDEAIRLDTRNPTSFNNRGAARSDLKDYSGAMRDHDSAILLDPKFAMAYYCRGIATHGLKNYTSAIEDYDEAIQLDPIFAKAFDKRGVSKQHLKNYSEAIKDYNVAIRLDPMSRNALQNKAFLLSTCPEASVRDAKLSMDLADRALAIDPKNAYAMNAKACALALSGSFDEAIRWQKKALEDRDYKDAGYITGGKFAEERIAKWEAHELWFIPVE